MEGRTGPIEIEGVDTHSYAGVSDSDSVLLFKAGGISACATLPQITEIIRLPPFTRVPLAEEWIEGLFNHRSDPVMAVSLRRCLGLEDDEESSGLLLLTGERGSQTAFRVDRVSDIVTPGAEEWQPVPEHVSLPYCTGILVREEDLYVSLNFTGLLDSLRGGSTSEQRARQGERLATLFDPRASVRFFAPERAGAAPADGVAPEPEAAETAAAAPASVSEVPLPDAPAPAQPAEEAVQPPSVIIPTVKRSFEVKDSRVAKPPVFGGMMFPMETHVNRMEEPRANPPVAEDAQTKREELRQAEPEPPSTGPVRTSSAAEIEPTVKRSFEVKDSKVAKPSVFGGMMFPMETHINQFGEQPTARESPTPPASPPPSLPPADSSGRVQPTVKRSFEVKDSKVAKPPVFGGMMFPLETHVPQPDAKAARPVRPRDDADASESSAPGPLSGLVGVMILVGFTVILWLLLTGKAPSRPTPAGRESVESGSAAPVPATVEIPAALPERPRLEPAPQPFETRQAPRTITLRGGPPYVEHRVVRGDSLSKISRRYLYDMMRYPELAEENHIPNPDLIYPGDVVRVPLPREEGEQD